MPVLANPTFERFAQLMAAGGRSKRDAYVEARLGDRTSVRGGHEINNNVMSVMASKLFKRPDVQRRIEQLRGTSKGAVAKMQIKIAGEVQMSLKSLIDEAEAARKGAEKEKQYSAVIKAIECKAKLGGFWVEKRENKNANYTISDQPMSMDEWKQRFVQPN